LNSLKSKKQERKKGKQVVRIRLRRVGKKGQPSYRVVVSDSESPRDGKFIEVIGFYNPRTVPPTIEIKNDRAVYWLSQGAQPSDAALRLLKKSGAMAEFATLKGETSVEEAVEEKEIAAVVEKETTGDEVEEETASEEAEEEIVPEAAGDTEAGEAETEEPEAE
jgi:small subunit ribosomal protein S16